VYRKAKQKFLDSPESVTNFPYFMTEAAYSGKITPRHVLVVDEAHNIESELSRFVEVAISERFVRSVLKSSLPRGMTQFQAYCWVRDVYFPKAKSQLKHFENTIEKANLSDKLKELTVIAKQYDLLSRHVSKLEMFLSEYNKENWIFDEEETYPKNIRKFVFKSIDVSKYAHQYLFHLGRQVLFMSATILSKDTFCRSLGIDPADAKFISMPSPFPTENRPVHFLPVGPMGAKHLQRTLPNLAVIVKQIIDQHPDEKGIIHCHTFRIAKYLKEHVKTKRILTHTSVNRDKILQKHLSSKLPTILLSPSMTEGVDLRGEYSRFQIICKVPYPYLGDKLVKKRMNKWKEWYPLQTAKSIVQAIGRSVRSKDDHAATYILDQDFDRFYRQNRNIFPKDFKDCLKTE
jgi:Rad3-related DNA helicase